ncbi:MAG: hypothetical protein PHV30_01365 [Candidatus Margulisbacteria bacterium]|nr:hypothetical protein [Candidatus Margulisiibacteriota bacterium]
MVQIDSENIFSINDSKQSLIATNKNEKYFLGDRKTFMQDLQKKIDQITKDMTDSSSDSMTIDGELIPDKNTPGAIFLINTKLQQIQDVNRTLVSTFDYLKKIEEEVSKLITQ